MAPPIKPLLDRLDAYADDDELSRSDSPEDPLVSPGVAMFEKPVTDHLIHAELYLPQGENLRSTKVIGRSKDDDGNVVGTYDTNPMLNSLVCDVEFPDGEIKEYSANIIAENMYSQVDSNGHHHTLLDSIVDYHAMTIRIETPEQLQGYHLSQFYFPAAHDE